MEILNVSHAGAIGKLWGPAVENMSHIKFQVVATRNNFYFTNMTLWFCSLLCFHDWVDESISHSRKNINYNQFKFYEITDFKHSSSWGASTLGVIHDTLHVAFLFLFFCEAIWDALVMHEKRYRKKFWFDSIYSLLWKKKWTASVYFSYTETIQNICI